MALGPGSRLDAHELIRLLGTGGMGDVWLATEVTLGRQVALKLLPADLIQDPARVSRFEQEARAASALNHPNVCTIHALGETPDGQHYIAMEYVEGETLRNRLNRLHPTIRESLDVAIQIASALAAAHAAGFVHRDIKPENVMLRPDGFVKVLDFGVAKLMSAGEALDAQSTRTAFRTEAGAAVGTVAYMAPEQARGEQVDHRTDIWALGCVLYEMVGGRSPFAAHSTSDTLVAILDREPAPLTRFEPEVPPEAVRMVAKALQKDRFRRYQTVQDLLLDLEALREDVRLRSMSRTGAHDHRMPDGGLGRSGRTLVDAAEQGPSRRRWTVRMTATAMALVLAALLIWMLRPAQRIAPVRLDVVPLTSDAGYEESPSFSPDGSQVAYSWNGEKEDNYDIYVKLIDTPGRLRLTTNPAEDRDPTFSPDGRWIGFVRLAQRRWTYIVVPAIGGTERVVAELPEEPANPMTTYGSIWSSAWMPDGKSVVLNGLRLLSLETGELRDLTTTSGTRIAGWFPTISPDRTAIAFARPSGLASFRIYRLAIATDGAFRGEPEQLASIDGDLWGITWTADSRDLVFASGRLSGTSGTLKVLWRLHATGKANPERVPAGENVTAPAIASHGERLAFVQNTLKVGLWLATVAEPGGRAEPPSRFAYSTHNEWNPQYSPDGGRVAFESNRTGESAIWVSAADGSGLMEIFSRAGKHSGTPRWAPDGRRLAFDSSAAGNFDVYMIEVGSVQPQRLTTHAADDAVPSWSPDGRWVYFSSSRTGRQEVWRVAAGGGPAIQVTRNGGACVFPSADGTQIYYTKLEAGSALWSMPAAGGPEHEVLPSVYKRNFVVVDGGVYFVPSPGPGERFGVYYLDSSTGATHSVTTLEGDPSYGLAVSPDRRYILYAQTERVGRDLMVVNGFR